MSPLRQALADYLAVRRALGFKLDRAERLLGQFTGHLEERQAAVITTEHALAWATSPGRGAVVPRAAAVGGPSVRGLAGATDPAHRDTPRQADRRRAAPGGAPYLYSPAEITALMEWRRPGCPARSTRSPTRP